MTLSEYVTTVREWARNQSLVRRAWIFGSRVRGTEHAGSDLDVAIEVIPMPGDENAGATWIGEADELEQSLQHRIDVPLDLERHGGTETPHITEYVCESSILVFERP
jgi:predicted nucleotidyltransferase